MNNCSISYDNYYWSLVIHLKRNDYYVNEEQPPIETFLNFTEVLPEYVAEFEYTYTKGRWWWKKNITRKYCVPKEGMVRLKRPVTHHTLQGNRWYIESQVGNIQTNIN